MNTVLVIRHPHPAQLDLSHLPDNIGKGMLYRGCTLRFAVPQNFRLPEACQHHLWQQQADCLVLPDVPFAHFRLIVSDMDATFTQTESLDQIAASAGLRDTIAPITAASMNGEIDFAQSLRQRTAAFAGLPVSILEQVYRTQMPLTAGALDLLAQCRADDIDFILISGGYDFFTERLRHKFGLTAAHANHAHIADGQLTGTLREPILDAQAKAQLLESHRLNRQLSREHVLAIGDGANDIPMLQSAGIGIAFHAHANVMQAADACIRFGGLDAVRDCFR